MYEYGNITDAELVEFAEREYKRSEGCGFFTDEEKGYFDYA
jgi:hypothetical protein